jgi:hypothetical protein
MHGTEIDNATDAGDPEPGQQMAANLLTARGFVRAAIWRSAGVHHNVSAPSAKRIQPALIAP